jgi:hypothetical protein
MALSKTIMKKYHNQRININLYRHNISVYNRYISKLDHNIFQNCVDTITRKVEIRCKHRGSLDAISYLKDMRVAVYAALGKHEIKIPLLSRTVDGYPTDLTLPIIRKLRDGDEDFIRLTLTILQLSRFIEGQKAPDYTPITDPTRYTVQIQKEFESRISQAMISMGLKPESPPKWKKPHFTSKGSPAGPAMLSIKHDLIYLPDTIVNDIGIVAGDRLHKYIFELRKRPDTLKTVREPKPNRIGRLRSHGLVEDTEGKTRVIAMADYWTQTSLRPLHDQLIGMLKGFGDCDLTFGQDIRPFGDSGHSYHSFDLTSATDRIPRFLYVLVMRYLYGQDYSESWERLMISIGFHGPDGHIRKYMTGQPMGLYSSWPLLAIVHHTIVQVAAHRLGLRRFSDYRILGDDIVIRHDEVANQYQELLRDLGVGISKTKTLVSKDTFEFAKRLFFRDVEVTAFPIHGVKSAIIISWQDLYSVLDTASRRNCGGLDTLIMPRLIEKFYVANARPLYLKGRVRDSKIDKTIVYKAISKAKRLGRTAYHYLKSFHIISEYRTDIPLFKETMKFWKIEYGCVTDTKSVLQAVLDRYSEKLISELQQSYMQTLEKLAKLTNTHWSNVRELLYSILDYGGYNFPDQMEEPLTWLTYDQTFAIEDADLRPPKDKQGFELMEFWTSALRKVNVRILDPEILDKSRVFERIFRLKSSCSIAAFTATGKDDQAPTTDYKVN